MTEQKHPMQPVVLDERGTARFKQNKIVRFLLDAGPFNLNTILATQPSEEDFQQFLQLIGYSVSGYGEYDFKNTESVRIADALEAQLKA